MKTPTLKPYSVFYVKTVYVEVVVEAADYGDAVRVAQGKLRKSVGWAGLRKHNYRGVRRIRRTKGRKIKLGITRS